MTAAEAKEMTKMHRKIIVKQNDEIVKKLRGPIDEVIQQAASVGREYCGYNHSILTIFQKELVLNSLLNDGYKVKDIPFDENQWYIRWW